MESNSTLKVFNALSDDKLSQSVIPGGYTLQSLAWHITTSINVLPAYAGVLPMPKKPPAPATVAEIVEAYKQNSARLAEAVEKKGTDAFLAEEVDFFGHATLRRGALLSYTISHQAHHRAQMTVLMKQAGLKVPGVYGPSEDDIKATQRSEVNSCATSVKRAE
jgi:uncharacterized damage-inducible protein DinB